MTESVNTASVLGEALCPWLVEPVRQMIDAAAAENLSHAWLITGGRGVGKLNLTMFLAARLLKPRTREDRWQRLSPPEASAAMRVRHSAYDHHPDLHLVSPEEGKQTISVEQVRSMADAISLKGFGGHGKVVIVEPAEAMTMAAANALLKTLEEPPAQTYLFLVTDTPGRLPATVRSRCQKLVVQRPSPDAVSQWFADARLETGELRTVCAQAGLGPIEAFDAIELEMSATFREYRDCIEGISARKLDPLAVASEWSKRDLDHVLGWLVRMLQLTIRSSVMPAGSTPVTESASHGLHNVCPGLDLAAFFGLLDKAETLRDRVGTGINVELGLQALLLEFRPN